MRRDAAMGAEPGRRLPPADLLVRNVRLLNTLSAEVHDADLCIRDGRVAGFFACEARRVLDGRGRIVVPGLVEGHIHIESTLLTPPEFARAVAGRGTAAVVADPHEIANVLGAAGVRYMVEASAALPVGIYFMAPSCVPATPLETAGARLEAPEIGRLFSDHPGRVIGLAEVMNVPGLLGGDPSLLAKVGAAAGRPIDGHAPGLSGADLSAYILAGPRSDHECTTLAEAGEKLRQGMFVMIREGTAERNLAALSPLARRGPTDRLMLVSDDRHPTDLVERGHLDHAVREAIGHGVDPVSAVRMATLTPARYFGLEGRGALSPGYRADFFFVDDLGDFRPREVHLAGRPLEELAFEAPVGPPGNSVRLGSIDASSFAVEPRPGPMNVIGLVPGQILTRGLRMSPTVKAGRVVADAGRDLAKLAVIERHKGSGRVGVGFVKGFGLRRGALASTVAHDSHNLVVAGMSDEEMRLAVRHLERLGGGLVVVAEGRVLADLPLPVAGLMSDLGLEAVVGAFGELERRARQLGDRVVEAPFMALSFLALPVIPELKLTDQGLVDVLRFERIGLFDGGEEGRRM